MKSWINIQYLEEPKDLQALLYRDVVSVVYKDSKLGITRPGLNLAVHTGNNCLIHKFVSSVSLKQRGKPVTILEVDRDLAKINQGSLVLDRFNCKKYVIGSKHLTYEYYFDFLDRTGLAEDELKEEPPRELVAEQLLGSKEDLDLLVFGDRVNLEYRFTWDELDISLRATYKAAFLEQKKGLYGFLVPTPNYSPRNITKVSASRENINVENNTVIFHEESCFGEIKSPIHNSFERWKAAIEKAGISF